jgi:hypothetical protein
VEGSLGKLKWRVYPTPRGEKGRILKRGKISEDFSRLPISRSLLDGEVLALLSPCFHNKSLLNSLTVFLPLNSSSSGETVTLRQ